jgi:hypothetical protein
VKAPTQYRPAEASAAFKSFGRTEIVPGKVVYPEEQKSEVLSGVYPETFHPKRGS